MKIEDEHLWRALEQGANGSEAFAAKSSGLSPLAIRFEIGEAAIELHVAHGHAQIVPGAQLRGYDVRIAGPREEWQRLLSGVISYPQAVNHAQGRLRIDGDLVASAWATPLICEFLRPSPVMLARKDRS